MTNSTFFSSDKILHEQIYMKLRLINKPAGEYMITVYDKKNNCYGCSSCVQICPSGAITFKEDVEGFSYPEINQSKCNDCGLCRKVCPIFKDVPSLDEVFPHIYAIWNKNDEVRGSSTSGGVFTALAKKIIDQSGVVFGAAFDDKNKVNHTGIASGEQLWKLQGSKYTQSNIGDSYKEARAFLREGKKVLFSGTPCQISGLYAYLGKSYENLYTCDCVCHGVPSPGVFELYKAHLEKLYKSEIKSFNFRNKSGSWKNYNIKVVFNNGSQHITDFREDPYMRGFIKNIYLRPSCHSCKYAAVKRHSDITLGDFWGIEKFNPALDDDKGTSLILANTPKGAEFLEACKADLEIHRADLSSAARENPSLVGPSNPHKNRDRFFSEMVGSDFGTLQNKFLRPTSKGRLAFNKFLRIPKKLLRLLKEKR